MPKTVKAIKVTNVSLPSPIFDHLCDELNKYRHYCHDYRMVSDYNIQKYGRYWQSGTYLDSDTIIIDATFEDVSDTANKFCLAAEFPKSAVKTEIVSYTLDD